MFIFFFINESLKDLNDDLQYNNCLILLENVSKIASRRAIFLQTVGNRNVKIQGTVAKQTFTILAIRIPASNTLM